MLAGLSPAILTLTLLASAPPTAMRVAPSTPAAAPIPLHFREFYEATPRELRPSERLLSLRNKRVRLLGFMARRLECSHSQPEAPTHAADAHPGRDGHSHDGERPHSVECRTMKGAFFLCAAPTVLAEGGAGTGDLPPTAVLVVVPGAEDRAIPHTPRSLSLVGRLEIGSRVEPDGWVSHIRLILDPIRKRRLVGPPAPFVRKKAL